MQVLYANSGPTYWEGTMAGEILAVDKETPIKVLEEQLLFEVEEESDDNTIAAQVTATYTFKNPPVKRHAQCRWHSPLLESLKA
ncbi:MAG: hypothetical protein H9893_12165 [Candidatus Niameybacter stercoravium]|nr:hypothetical protein [Candidatus Niameybacter stercoravium]